MRGFEEMFERLTGYEPMRWQCRLYQQWLAGDIKPAIDLPTGMGKTSAMAIWFIARATQAKSNAPHLLPTRLVYVVDRRTVVDQATTLAEAIKKKAQSAGLEPPAVSTLRGQFADNREWTHDPSKPAIIIGTVDMIGSRLLFSGYRSSYKQRPLDAGLLAQDSLLLLDEAHLSKPFAKLLSAISDRGQFQKGRGGRPCGSPMKVVRMSATVGGDSEHCFRLESSDLEGNRENNCVLRRYAADKHLSLHENTQDVRGKIARAATELAGDDSRVVIFVRSPDDADKIAEQIKAYGGGNRPFKNAVAILTGTMRGLERDELLQPPDSDQQHSRRVMQRFLKAKNDPEGGPAILVSTSAGEVGFDLNADHLVCDAAPLDSIIQRLGRVNRRGSGVAKVHLFAGRPKGGKKKSTAKQGQDSAPAHTYETASTKTLEILKQLPKLPDGSLDASPKAFDYLKKPDNDSALTPKPAIVEVTDILLDAWSMTTIVEPMPGRPPVANWLRGIAPDLPETTIAWRAELDVDGFGDLDISDVEEWFDAHRILPHETLTVPTYKAAEWIRDRWDDLNEQTQRRIGAHHCVIDRAGLRTIELETLANRAREEQIDDLLNHADLILPASFGGVEPASGTLTSRLPDSNVGGWDKAADVADKIIPDSDRRYRLIRTAECEEPLAGEMPEKPENLSRFVLELPSGEDTNPQLVSLVPKRMRPEFGMREQYLDEHVAAVKRCAGDIANRLRLENPIRAALEAAAEWHDQGKVREIWQLAVGGNVEHPLAKSGGKRRRIPGGYRHEFGSLREFSDALHSKTDAEVFDLAMHLIATHHGRGRPHFPKGGFDPDARRLSPEVATAILRRFARLQRKYSYWYLAWLENLLRCADAMASADNDRKGNNG